MSTTATTVVKTKQNALKKPAHEPHVVPLTCIRIILLYVVYLTYVNADIIQGSIDYIWSWLRHQWWYEIVYFETFLVPFYAIPALFPYRLIHRTGIGEKYKIEAIGGEYGMVPTHKNIIRETLEYMWPFFILDTFHVKHYAGVPDDVISIKRMDWIQRTRALPEASPQLFDIVRHLVVALILYDLCFFLSHYTFHKHSTLYNSTMEWLRLLGHLIAIVKLPVTWPRWAYRAIAFLEKPRNADIPTIAAMQLSGLFHSVHHDHKSVNAKVANQLHVVERIILVLSANFGLKVQGAHPLTRTFFVFLFLGVLIDNHSGYDFPYSYDKILPRGLIAGPRKHYEHHVHGTRNYQPFLTYIDNTLEWYRKRQKEK